MAMAHTVSFNEDALHMDRMSHKSVPHSHSRLGHLDSYVSIWYKDVGRMHSPRKDFGITLVTRQTRRLSSQDAAFLYFELPDVPLGVCSLAIYEGRISYERFVHHIESRLPLLPRFRQRLAFVPFNVAHPTWEDDPDFDIRNHVKHAPLPAPGTDEQLRVLTAKLFEPALDREKPVWEMYVINGLQGDRTAILTKAHHCMVDGAAGAEMLIATLDTSPEPTPPPESKPWRPRAIPTAATRLRQALWHVAKEQLGLLRSLGRWLLKPRPLIRQIHEIVRMHTKTAPWMMRAAPKMPFTRKLGRERRFAFGRMPLAEIRQVREALGGTVNDVAIAVLTGALRTYLLAHDERVDGEEPRIAIPVNVRPPRNQIEIGNRISGIVAPLPIDQASAAERLSAVRSRMYTLKKERQAATIELIMRAASRVPAPLQVLVTRLPIANRFFNVFNVGFSSAADIRVPLYCVGHRMLEHYAPPPLVRGVGLGAAVVRYDEDLFWSLTAEPNAMPDLDDFKRMFEQSYADLVEAARATAPVSSVNGRSSGGARPADAQPSPSGLR